MAAENDYTPPHAAKSDLAFLGQPNSGCPLGN